MTKRDPQGFRRAGPADYFIGSAGLSVLQIHSVVEGSSVTGSVLSSSGCRIGGAVAGSSCVK